jgi:hypothetical protein
MLSILVLWLILYIVAKHNAVLDFRSIVFVSIGLGVGSFLIHLFLFPIISYFALIPIALFSIWVLMRYCYLTLKQASIVLVLYIIADVLLDAAFEMLTATS